MPEKETSPVPHPQENKSFLKKLIALFLMIGPGLFCVGYTIGTGSVTTMISAGSAYGTSLLWVVFLSCLFSGFLMEAYGRYAVVTGRTALHSFRTELPCGKFFALLTMIMLIAGQWCCLSGLVGCSSDALYQCGRLCFPGFWEQLGLNARYGALAIAILLLFGLYLIFWFGNYSRIETFLAAIVAILGISFLISLFIVAPTLRQIFGGMIPSIPKTGTGTNPAILLAAMVGTTLAAPTFVVRPLLVISKGWKIDDQKKQRNDCFCSALTMFIISGSILCVAAGAIYYRGGEPIRAVLDMVEPLRPIAGEWATLIFILGFVSAGVSSILPIAMVAGFLLGDIRNGEIKINAPVFRILAGIACLIGLMVPILGAPPVAAQITTQIAQVFVLPLVIGGILVLINRKSLMGKYRAGFFLNFGLIASFLFSLFVIYGTISNMFK